MPFTLAVSTATAWAKANMQGRASMPHMVVISSGSHQRALRPAFYKESAGQRQLSVNVAQKPLLNETCLNAAMRHPPGAVCPVFSITRGASASTGFNPVGIGVSANACHTNSCYLIDENMSGYQTNGFTVSNIRLGYMLNNGLEIFACSKTCSTTALRQDFMMTVSPAACFHSARCGINV